MILEDAAQALGASRAGQRAGAWGHAACFSFHPSKPLGAAGDAGAVTTSDPRLAERVRRLGSHGERDGLHVEAGTSSRLDAIQAAVLRVKLPHLKTWTEARARNARVYAEELADCRGVTLPPAPAAEVLSWSQFAIRCVNPEPVERALAAEGIEWRRYYRRPAPAEPAAGGHAAGAFPEAARACRETLCLPIRGSCSVATVREIARTIRAAVD
jgi:dTDP-4-amino-4,6-dideoxygalactose transaminase